MKATILTEQQIRDCEGKEYNPQVWNDKIDRMLNYDNVVFYHVPKGDGYDYDRYFVEYTLPEGLRLFRSLSYSTSITSGGFFRLDKIPVTKLGETHGDVISYLHDGDSDKASALLSELESTSIFEITYGQFHLEDGSKVTIGNSSKAREWMTIRSQKYGITFTKGH